VWRQSWAGCCLERVHGWEALGSAWLSRRRDCARRDGRAVVAIVSVSCLVVRNRDGSMWVPLPTASVVRPRLGFAVELGSYSVGRTEGYSGVSLRRSVVRELTNRWVGRLGTAVSGGCLPSGGLCSRLGDECVLVVSRVDSCLPWNDR
jgi:hypothetical protein